MFQLACIRKALLPVVLVSCYLFDSSVPHTLSATVQAVRLTGRVIDVNEAAIANASVCVTGPDGIRKVISDASGNYAIELPPGTYTVTTDVPGFHTFERAPFTLLPQTETIINLTLWASVGASHSVPLQPQIHYERIALQAPSRDVIIQFRTEKRLEKATEYGVLIITCDQLTLKADKGLFYRDRNRIELEGNTMVEDGKVTTRARRLQLDLSPKGVSIEVIKGSITGTSGQGSIDGFNIDFSFSVTVPNKGYLTYKDKKEGMQLISTALHSLRTVDDATNVITFCGVGRINEILATAFTVVVEHEESGRVADKFSIEFDGYARSGSLTQGKVTVNREY